MEENAFNRRNFLAAIPALSLINFIPAKPDEFPISCNSYNWITFFARQGRNWGENLDENIAEFSKSGIKAFEPSITDTDFAKNIIFALKKHNIAMPSIYVNSVLHEEKDIENSLKSILEIADIVKSYGTKIIVTNPNPIKWGGKELKSDKQLKLQAQAMEKLGAALRNKGIKLAYHTHDVELRAGAREFHHILQNTTSQNVYFCFDVHWVYRGSENSEIAVFDVLKMYGNRIAELHVRQSKNGIWSETFTPEGDIDYKKFAAELAVKNINPHIVIEQCVEEKSPNTMDGIAAHKLDLAAINQTFKKS